MKRCFIAFFAVVLLMFSCTGKKSGQLDEVPADSVADSIDTTEVDSLEMLIAETPMPRAADAMFDDFIFNFVANKKLQKERVVFPLRTREGEKVSMTEKDQWKMEHFFMRQGYYTLLFDSDEQMSHQKDTAISEAIVEKIQLRKKRVTSYYFVRIKGAWMMKEVVVTPIAENPNASFLEFYQRFVTDSAYQVAHLNKTVTFISPDPDDDFTMMEGVITPETWSAFASDDLPDARCGQRTGDGTAFQEVWHALATDENGNMINEINYSLKSHNTFGIDAKCSRFLAFENEQEAQQVAEILRTSDTPYIIIGGGSNLLLTKDFEGIVVRSGITGYRFETDCRMVCGSGEVWDDIVALSIKAGYYGLENLSLIPGDVGASAVQNIGAYGVEAKDFICQVHAVEIATGRRCVFSNEDCRYGYRDSRFKHEWKNRYLITSVEYALQQQFGTRTERHRESYCPAGERRDYRYPQCQTA